MDLKDIDITISFSGHNVKKFLILAIESFLHFFPGSEDKIVVFDDGSTDGTKEFLTEKGIKVITWTIDKSVLDVEHRGYITPPVRVNNIVTEIMKQVNTKYLFVNDSDVIFVNDQFLNHYLQNVDKYKVFGIKSVYVFNTTHYEKNDPEIDVLREKYKNHFEILDDVKNPFNGWKILPKIPQNHMFVDLDYLKSMNLLYDCLDDKAYSNKLGNLVDSGVDFYCKLKDNNVPVFEINNAFLQDVIHFHGINMDVHLGTESHPMYRIPLIEQALSYDFVQDILKKYNMNLYSLK
jgi:glycosyltransferase involved in cell wall biosynthesis